MTDEDPRQSPLPGTLKEISDALLAPVPAMRRGVKSGLPGTGAGSSKRPTSTNSKPRRP